MKLFGNIPFLVLGALFVISASVGIPSSSPAQVPQTTDTAEMPSANQLIPPAPAGAAPRAVDLTKTVIQPAPASQANTAPPVAPTATSPANPTTTASSATPAELAIIQNASKLDSISPPGDSEHHGSKKTQKGKVTGTDKGSKVTDILEQGGATVPPPNLYLVVKKDHNADDFDSRLTTALTSLSHGQYAAALELFNALYTSNPGEKRVLMGRAVTMQKMGMNAEAQLAYEEVLKRDPKNLEALTNILGILKNQDPAAAIEKLRQLHDIYPASADIAAQLGLVYGTTGEYQMALKYLEIADSLKPGSLDTLYNRAVVYDRMGNKQQATDLYRQIISLSGDNSLDPHFPIETVRKRLSTMR
ncbi:MAG: tetratricopeptide repeat protein [Proteobacteria bacterium]|nr:tetratricopeptide repeat protein [Pseudomonadota bacterium]